MPKTPNAKSVDVFEIDHSGVYGLIDKIPTGGAKYFVTFIDQYSSWSSVYPMKQKSNVFECLKELLSLTERQTGHKIDIDSVGWRRREQ